MNTFLSTFQQTHFQSKTLHFPLHGPSLPWAHLYMQYFYTSEINQLQSQSWDHCLGKQSHTAVHQQSSVEQRHAHLNTSDYVTEHVFYESIFQS